MNDVIDHEHDDLGDVVVVMEAGADNKCLMSRIGDGLLIGQLSLVSDWSIVRSLTR